MKFALVICAVAAAAGPPMLHAQSPCPLEAGGLVEQGWKAYRDGAMEVAEHRFTRADKLCDRNLDAKVGLGYTHLRQDHAESADSLFQLVLSADSLNADAWAGYALAASRLGSPATSRAAAARAIALDSTNTAARQILDRISPGWDRPPPAAYVRPDTLKVAARTHGTRFEIPDGDTWSPFYVKGVNMGVALPGRFPAEFPTDSARYAGWFDLIAGMNANSIRLYTVLPPEFYRALLGYNLNNPDNPLYLIHGVWTGLPPEHDFESPAWKSAFRDEMRRVVDVIHGRADIPARPGHASGRYDAEVSLWTLAYIIGREWEPFAVVAFNEQHPGSRTFRGKFLQAEGPVTDMWMAEQCDYMLAYEVEKWNSIRPIAYTNWPTLDPLHHPTEATAEEEQEWRRRRGRPFLKVSAEYDNDAIGLDANLVRPTSANPAGWFATYHAYPYYPDFMLYDTGYNTASSSEGRSNYFGYLRELVRHHEVPVLIAEYGVPSSKGVAHWQPQGWTHGGHDEKEMSRIDDRLTREIHESGAAGGIIFAWMDEWFKKNWVVSELQIPAEHIPRWHNARDAEQNYGILGMYAGHPDSTPELGGDPDRWTRSTALMETGEGPITAFHVYQDEAYVYLGIRLEPGDDLLNWRSGGVMVGIDTYRPDEGQHRLPGLDVQAGPGFEFLVDLRSPDDGQLRIVPGYDPYGGPPDSTGDDRGLFYSRPAMTSDRSDGIFDSMFVITNRARFGRDGTFFPALGYNRGGLRYGTAEESSLSDWFYDREAGLIEIRLPWGLLNVTDPSTRTVLDDRTGEGGFGTTKTDGFRFGVILYSGETSRTVDGALPSLEAQRWSPEEFPVWTWSTWEMPEYHARLKPVYEELRETWSDLR